MSLGHGASIVKSGLALHYDAANKKCYPGSGTVVTDLSGNGRSGIAFNGLAFSSSNNGSFRYDGVNDGIQTTSAQNYITSALTADVWVKVDAHGNFHNFVNNNWINSGWIIYSTSTQWVGGVAQSNTQHNAGANHNNSLEWVNLCLSYDGFDVRLYVNGVLITTNTSVPDGLTFDSNVNIIFGNSSRPSAYNISAIKLYNRALSTLEVQQNFEAVRGRYGI